MDKPFKSRGQKLVDAIYPFFWKIAVDSKRESYSLRVCRHLIALRHQAIDDPCIAPFLRQWAHEHPEENPLKNDELLWALHMLEEYIAKRVYKKKLEYVKVNGPRSKFWIVKGGLSANPDREYIASENFLNKTGRIFE